VRVVHSEFVFCAVVTLRRVAARSAVIAVCSSAPLAPQRPARWAKDPRRLSLALAAPLALLAKAFAGDRAALDSIMALLKFICEGAPCTAEDRLQQAMPDLIALPAAAMPAVAAFLRTVLESPYPLALKSSSAPAAAAQARMWSTLGAGVAAVDAAAAALPPPPRRPAGARGKLAAPAGAAGGEADAGTRAPPHAPPATKKARTGARS